MRIAIIADPYIPVPPLTYGGIERIIDFLIKDLSASGHEVLLVAHPLSKVQVQLISYGNQQSRLKHAHNILAVNKIKKFKPDVINSFGRLFYLLPFLRSDTPKIMSYQREPTLSQIKKAVTLSKKNTLSFTGCSNYISNKIRPFASATTIYNGFPIGIYEPNFKFNESAPLVFLGRIEHIKGTHIAIEVAQKTNKPLIIAGNIPEGEENYFNEKIKPHLSDKIKYIGPVNDAQKNELLNQALAFLMPILWNEPFGIVMAEAMACGTPVVGFAKGSVPEVVANNTTGFICNTTSQMIDAISKLPTIDRKTVWEIANNKFSSTNITAEYIQLYEQKIYLTK